MADMIVTTEVLKLDDGRWQMRLCRDGNEIADMIVTTEVLKLDDGRWQMRVCCDGVEVERFDPVETAGQAKRLADDFESMVLQSPGSRRMRNA